MGLVLIPWRRWSHKKAWIPCLLWTFLVLGFMLYPGDKIPHAVGQYDKLGHALSYGILSFLWVVSLHLTFNWPRWVLIVVPIAISAAHAGATEGAQWLFTAQHRSSDWGDFWAGFAGGCIGLGVYITYRLAVRQGAAFQTEGARPVLSS